MEQAGIQTGVYLERLLVNDTDERQKIKDKDAHAYPHWCCSLPLFSCIFICVGVIQK